MDFDGGFTGIDIPLKVIFIDLLLSGDNAVLIALACRSLPDDLRRRAIFFGTGAAIVLRFLLTAIVGAVLLVPYLKIVGGGVLLAIAIKLLVGEEDSGEDGHSADGLWSAVRIIVVADLVMSFDNVVALAAAVRGSYLYLGLGLLLSVPLLVYGSTMVGKLLARFPALVTAGGALLGWLAGDLAVTDPAVSGWIDSQAFALKGAIPAAAALFAVLHARIIAGYPQPLAARRPTLPPAPPPVATPVSPPVTAPVPAPAPVSPPTPAPIPAPAVAEAVTAAVEERSLAVRPSVPAPAPKAPPAAQEPFDPMTFLPFAVMGVMFGAGILFAVWLSSRM